MLFAPVLQSAKFSSDGPNASHSGKPHETVVIVYLAFLTSASAAADITTLRRGEALLKRNCSRCHAIGSVASARAGIRKLHLFRTLAKRYPVEFLAHVSPQTWARGSSRRGHHLCHTDMPEYRFSGDDVGAIVMYLKSIQEA
jgi:cytochrome c